MSNLCSVKSVLFQHLPRYRQTHTLSRHQSQVCSHILTCHTPALGSVAEQQCDQCDYTRPCYHSCRDRHCPSCQRDASEAWCERQREALLPVTYHHLVFTLPSSLNAWVSLHPKVIYRVLFESVWNTLSHFGNDPKRLNGHIGATMVLHTWGENLSRHVHLHCLVPGGALGSDGAWHAACETYLFPVRALSRRFRGRMVSALRIAANKGELHRIKCPKELDQVLDELMKPDWVVFSKPCPTNTGSVIDYLGRYSHRIAISDQRIVSIGDEQVQFQYKDYAGGGQRKTMTLDAMEFIRRYLLHVLPKGLMRIRHYGLLANRCRRKKLKLIREALNASSVPVKEQEKPRTPTTSKGTDTLMACPKCRKGQLRFFTLSSHSRLTDT
jgi:hypothetical protein